ncbi:MAG: hypothetical protein R6U32_06525 [Candidatus Woesearchaeota archaeon]
MKKEVREDILKILDEVFEAFRKEDYTSLKDISDHTIHNASIFQDKDSVSVAVITFSLYKITSSSKGKEKQACRNILRLMKEARRLLSGGKDGAYRRAVKKIFDAISDLDKKFRHYIEEVINQAQIKKGSRIHEHGISIARAADILGVSQWELMNYVGKTSIAERGKERLRVRDRLKFAKRLFSMD